MDTQQIDRQQLQRALIASGCSMTLDDALADPTLARCLRLTAQAMHRGNSNSSAPAQNTAPPDELAWARRLLALAGTADWAKLRAGDVDRDQQP